MDRFETMGETLEKISGHLTTQDKTLQSQVESRDRQRKRVRWVGSIGATVVAAVLLICLWLK